MKLNHLVLPLLLATLAARQTSTPKEPKCLIQGLVVQDPASRPLKKVNVEIRLLDQEGSKTYKSTTDADGHFLFEDLDAGRYNLHIERPGFLELKYHSPMFGGHTLTLHTGEEIKDVVLHMQPAAVIIGKVLDGDGDPLPDVLIMVTRFGVPSFGGQYHAVENVTNDLGEYRVGNLPPGKYLIKATQMNVSAGATETKNRDGSKKTIPYTTYYPSTSDQSQAVPLELHAGDEIPINLTMTYGPSFHVRGVMSGLTHSNGEVQMILRAQDDQPWMNQFSSTVKDDGSFEASNVLPGKYQAMFFSISGSEPEVVTASQIIEVKDSDLDSLRLAPELPALVSGRLRAENNPKLDWTHFSIQLEPINDSEFTEVYSEYGFRTGSWIKNDGSFEIKKVPPGKYHLVLYARDNAMQNYYVKTVNAGGSDVTAAGFTVSGVPLSLDIVLSANSSTIEGVVVDGKDQPVKDAIVVAVPGKELRQWKNMFKQSTTDQHGRFVFNGLRPGEYTVLSLEDMEYEDYHEPDFIKNYEDSAEKVRVDGGEHKNIVTKLISQAPQK